MKLLIFLVGLFIVGVASAYFMFPSLVESLIKWSEKRQNLNYSVVLRVVIGVILITGAPVTAYPVAIWWLGAFFITAGLILALWPAESIQRILAYMLERPVMIIRAWVLVVVALGAFILHSVMIL
jgi:hypothetical protein